MPLQCKEVEYCKLMVQYSADHDKIVEARSNAVKQVKQAKIKIPGFRPGKATNEAILHRYKSQIEEMVKKELTAQAYDDVIFETKIKPIGYPQVLNVQLYESSFFCDMMFLKKPEFELKEYKGFKIPKPHIPHTPTEIAEKLIHQARTECGDVIPYNDGEFTQVGDNITADISCKIGGEDIPQLSKDGILYKIGSGLINGFDDSILGMEPGETRSFDLALTNNVPEDLLNKTATFSVKLHMGTKVKLADMNDEFAKKVNYNSLADFEKAAYGLASTKLNMLSKQLVSQQAVLRLLANHDFEIPSWLILMESSHKAQENNVKFEDLTDSEKEELNKRSKDSVKLSLILDTIRDKEPETVFSDQELLGAVRNRMGKDGEEFLMKAAKNGSLHGILAALKDENTIQWVVDSCEIIE